MAIFEPAFDMGFILNLPPYGLPPRYHFHCFFHGAPTIRVELRYHEGTEPYDFLDEDYILIGHFEATPAQVHQIIAHCEAIHVHCSGDSDFEDDQIYYFF